MDKETDGKETDGKETDGKETDGKETDGKEVYLVKRNGRPMREFSNAEARQILSDFADFDVRLACARDVVKARARGASWPYGGWIANGQSVMLDSQRGYCPRGIMCGEHLERRVKGTGHLQYFQHRLNDGIIVGEQAVGYVLYGRKPSPDNIPAGYTIFGCVVPDSNNAAFAGKGTWSCADVKHPQDPKLYVVVVEGDDAYREQANERGHAVFVELNRRGHVVSQATYNDVVRAADKDHVSQAAGWTVDLELVETCNGRVVINNPKGKPTGYVMYGDRPVDGEIQGFRIFDL